MALLDDVSEKHLRECIKNNKEPDRNKLTGMTREDILNYFYDTQIFKFSEDKTKKFYEAIKEFDLIANNKEYQWRHVLKPGELLIFNNWRILHGRGSFSGERKMSGCYINKEDFDSSCRIHNII